MLQEESTYPGLHSRGVNPWTASTPMDFCWTENSINFVERRLTSGDSSLNVQCSVCLLPHGSNLRIPEFMRSVDHDFSLDKCLVYR